MIEFEKFEFIFRLIGPKFAMTNRDTKITINQKLGAHLTFTQNGEKNAVNLILAMNQC